MRTLLEEYLRRQERKHQPWPEHLIRFTHWHFTEERSRHTCEDCGADLEPWRLHRCDYCVAHVPVQAEVKAA